MHYHEAMPEGALSEYVSAFWEFTVSPNLATDYEHVIPVDGSTSIAFVEMRRDLPGCMLVGPRTSSLRVVVQPGSRFWGFRLLPWASRSVLGVDGQALCGKHEPLFLHSPKQDKLLYAAFTKSDSFDDVRKHVEQVVLDCAASQSKPDPAVVNGVMELVRSHGQAKVSEVAYQVACSERQFLRLFRMEVGLTPKQFARVCRMRTAAMQAVDDQEPKWGFIASEHGYADQSHFVREFNSIFGMTPSEFERTFLPTVSHGSLRRD